MAVLYALAMFLDNEAANKREVSLMLPSKTRSKTMTRQEMEALANEILMIDPEQELLAMQREQECKAAWTDEDCEQDEDISRYLVGQVA